MSDVNLEFVVNPNNFNVTVSNNDITFTPSDIQLDIFSAGIGVPAGNIGEVQINGGGVLIGAPGLIYDINTNSTSCSNLIVTTSANLGSNANIIITGGSNAFVLGTNGAGNLAWTSNIANSNFANTANVANMANIANYAGNVTVAAQPNITSLGTLVNLTSAGNINFTSAANIALGTISNIHITGGTNGYVIQTDGTGNLNWTALTGSGNGNPGGANTQVQYNDSGLFNGSVGFTYNNITGNLNVPTINANLYGLVQTNSQPNITSLGTLQDTTLGASNSFTGGNLVSANYITGTLTTNSQPNITSVGSLVSLSVDGTTSVYETIENVSLIGAQSGTYNFDVLNGAIQYSTANASANVILNFRGNSTTTFDSIIGNGKSLTATYLITNSANAYTVSSIDIDGSAETIKYVNGVTPLAFANATQSFTFTIIKTSTTPTYTILGSMTRYA